MMKHKTIFAALFGAALCFSTLLSPAAMALGIGYGCGTMCFAQMQSYCPTCAMAQQQQMMSAGMMPWGMSQPYWWGAGPMMYNNFYQPGPWSMGPSPGMMPGVNGMMYPGSGNVGIAKPNIYVHGPQGTEVTFKLKFVEEGSNWLASVPAHGTDGWKGTIAEKDKFQTADGLYRYLYSDYRVYGKNFQDQHGFCTSKNDVIGKMARQLKEASFTGREIADFIEYWSVKLPKSNSYCVYPQDEHQLATVATFEVTPKPAAVRRVLFMLQTEEGLGKASPMGKFAARPASPWHPEPLRVPANDQTAVTVHEWGVGFLFVKP